MPKKYTVEVEIPPTEKEQGHIICNEKCILKIDGDWICKMGWDEEEEGFVHPGPKCPRYKEGK